MDPITLIVTALAAGAASAMQDDAKSAVKTAFERLRQLVKKRFKDPANGQYLLEKHSAKPDIWEEPLKEELAESGAGGDQALVSAAQELLKLVDERGAAAGKYNVTIQDSQGVQAGDNNSWVS
jgi:hypothetical protein